MTTEPQTGATRPRMAVIDDAAASDAFIPILQQLRRGLDAPACRAALDRQRAQGYRMLGAYDTAAGRPLGIAGFWERENLAWGRHVYVDDLVVDATSRGTGVGEALLDELMRFAGRLGCASLHLDSGVQRHAAHRFYIRAGFRITSHHFAVDL